ncbi:haloacid dehalogenase-like hydrolase, putative [Synechococcus sp. PCC 7335]|nr:haloacid dehalogenase-like hydrolase, putative [Synechococcus sp. PCC 7335]
MDGTLTKSLHDFPAISRALGLPPNQPILEALEHLPPDERATCNRQLAVIETDIAYQATAQPGARRLLSTLKSKGKQVGILTRNTKDIVHITLTACGLADFFHPDDILGRSCCPPKPQPDGILKLLANWSLGPESAVMVGDHKFDLLTGRNAKTATVYLDPQGKFPFAAHADYSITSLEELSESIYTH